MTDICRQLQCPYAHIRVDGQLTSEAVNICDM